MGEDSAASHRPPQSCLCIGYGRLAHWSDSRLLIGSLTLTRQPDCALGPAAMRGR